MGEYKITMHRAPNISDEERRRCLHRAYQILLDAARRTRLQNMADEKEAQTSPGTDAAQGEKEVQQ